MADPQPVAITSKDVAVEKEMVTIDGNHYVLVDSIKQLTTAIKELSSRFTK